jgi:HAD superfamily hydrolase (TIGR01509 family)
VVRALLLDLDDTLFDRGAAIQAWARARLRRDLEACEWREWLAIDQRGRRPRCEFAADAARFGLTVDPERFPFELAEHVAPEPGARDAIARLAARLPVAVVTNGGAAQRAKLDRIGLADVVHAVFVSGELGTAKPEPAMFERALQWAGEPPDRVLFVGDNPLVDLVPAAALGMGTAWRPRGGEVWPCWLAAPDHVIDQVADLEPICASPDARSVSGP